jgi:hypothetical protein
MLARNKLPTIQSGKVVCDIIIEQDTKPDLGRWADSSLRLFA